MKYRNEEYTTQQMNMMRKATQEELQAATNATLRAHATSDEAKALVARLAAMVDEMCSRAGPLF